MLYIQLIGLLAFFMLVLSYYKKKTITILLYQATANFAYFIHYFLLGGLSGAFICLINIVRNIALIKFKNIITPIIIMLLYLVVTLIFYEGIYSLLPMIASTFYVICILYNTRKHLLIGEIVGSSLWVLYSIIVLSYTGIITSLILIVSNGIQLIKLKR